MDDMKNIIKNAFNHKISQANLCKPQFELLNEKLKNINSSRETSFLNKVRMNICYYTSRRKAVLTTIICLAVFSLTLTLYTPVRSFAEKILKKIYIVHEDDGEFKIKQIEVEDEPLSPTQMLDVSNLSDTEIWEKLGYEVTIPSELPDDYLMVQKIIRNDADERIVSVMYTKQNSDKEAEFIALSITDLKWPLFGTKFSLDGIEFYYKEAGVAADRIDEYGNLTFDLEVKPNTIDLVHTLAWRIDNVTYRLSDVGGRDLTKDQLLEYAKFFLPK